MRDHGLTVNTGVPPATILVTDEQGRRAGVDPAIMLDEVGLPPFEVLPGAPPIHRSLGVLEEIPNTEVDVQNIASNEPPFEPQRSTGWTVSICDGGAQAYTVTLGGLKPGVSEVRIRPRRTGGRRMMLPVAYTSVLVDTGVTRQLRVTFDPFRDFALVIERVNTAAGLEEDVRIARHLDLVAPEGVGRSLEAKAAAVAAAQARGNMKAVRGQLGAFLEELKAQGGKHVQEPALTILREEAEALLNPPPPMAKVKRLKTGVGAKPGK
jgi:hypothetical protein